MSETSTPEPPHQDRSSPDILATCRFRSCLRVVLWFVLGAGLSDSKNGQLGIKEGGWIIGICVTLIAGTTTHYVNGFVCAVAAWGCSFLTSLWTMSVLSHSNRSGWETCQVVFSGNGRDVEHKFTPMTIWIMRATLGLCAITFGMCFNNAFSRHCLYVPGQSIKF